jgi:peptidoglycan/LPS O-acetylase OafA/YrhL
LPLLRETGLPFINFALTYAAVIISTVAISSITYLFIEVPIIGLGSRLIESRWSLTIQPAEA